MVVSSFQLAFMMILEVGMHATLRRTQHTVHLLRTS
jgi:hypothetical protein